jgi:LysR family glycine cleavage system transcriptional activator
MVPLNAIRAFVLAARTSSFTEAARLLNVTQGAVSQHVARLADYLGVQLFIRSGRRLTLTAEGRRFYVAVAASVERIDNMAAVTRAARFHQTLTIATLSSLAAKWLVPRLPRFHAQHPTLRLSVQTSVEAIPVGTSIDAVIRFGTGHWPGLESRRLFADWLFPVTTPAFAASLDLEAGPSVLKGVPLYYDLDGVTEWQEWFTAAGIDAEQVNLTFGFNDSLVALNALVDGVPGVAMMRDSIVALDVRNGALVRLFDTTVATNGAFYIATPTERTPSPAMIAFRDWVIDEAQRYQSERDAGEV